MALGMFVLCKCGLYIFLCRYFSRTRLFTPIFILLKSLVLLVSNITIVFLFNCPRLYVCLSHWVFLQVFMLQGKVDEKDLEIERLKDELQQKKLRREQESNAGDWRDDTAEDFKQISVSLDFNFLLEMVKLLLWFLLKFITVYCIQVVRSNFSWKCATVIYYCSVVHKNYNYHINHPYATENESWVPWSTPCSGFFAWFEKIVEETVTHTKHHNLFAKVSAWFFQFKVQTSQ